MAAQAGDLCLNAALGGELSLGNPVIIGRGFTFPNKNKCKPFVGVIVTSIPARPSAVTGSACASFDGSLVSFTLLAALLPVDPDTANSGDFLALRYGARVIVEGRSTGRGLLNRFVTDDTVSASNLVAFECHNAFPDNL